MNFVSYVVVNFRHVMLPSNLVPLVPVDHLMTETEWRNLGVQQSPGWVHYMIHSPGKIDFMGSCFGQCHSLIISFPPV